MSKITSIEIKYFRSIYRVKLNNIHNLNIITGKNDVGKSNILRALNLFFNNCIKEDGDFVFYDNYNLRRLNEVRSIKAKQTISISITFDRGEKYRNTLPRTFAVTKTWNRDSEQPTVTDNLRTALRNEGRKYTDRSAASLTRFLNGLVYIYIPAIKDNLIFDNMIRTLQEKVYVEKFERNEDVSSLINRLNTEVSLTTEALSKEFYAATDIRSDISIPSKISDLYKSLKITTQSKDGEILLDNRGDGVRVRYIPSIINYIAINSKQHYIWGFEEPENSLEFNLARKMAHDFQNIYSKQSDIFVTTHNPAFVDLGNSVNVGGFRCFYENGTKIANFNDAVNLPNLDEELGYAQILENQYREFEKVVQERTELSKRVETLSIQVGDMERPILITEGKTDWKHLKAAMKSLGIDDIDITIREYEENLGDIALKGILNKCAMISPKSKIIGMFDRDNLSRVDIDEISDKEYVKLSKNVYAFAIPSVREEDYGKDISIEHYYKRTDLLKENKYGRRLFVGNEFDKLGCSHDGKFVTKFSGIDKKCQSSAIVDDKVFVLHETENSVAMSKNDFADLVLENEEYSKDFDFEEFEKIFDVIKKIIKE